MRIMKFFLIVLLVSDSAVFALTRQDLERMKSELDNPVTLETVETSLLESGLPFMKVKNQNSCTYYYSHSEPHVKTFKIVIGFHSYAGKEIVHRINWSSDYSYYKIVNGRFQSDESYYRVSPSSEKDRDKNEKQMKIFNSILDKIENGKALYWPHSGRCENCAIQMMSLYSLSEQLGSQGACNDGYGVEKQTCNYRINLGDGMPADVTIEYMSSGENYDDYTPVSIKFNDKQGADDGLKNAASIKTVKIGKQEWMDHNLLYGEGLTAKYGVGIVADEDLSNFTDFDYNSKSIALPSGERNRWFEFMDLNLRSDEKPNIKENHQGVCPIGFHVPTIAEWKELFSFVVKDKVKFPKYELFDAYEEAVEKLPNNFELAFASASDLKKIRKQQEKLESIEKELDAAYNKWRKGRKDGFNCNKGEKCRYNKHDMRNTIEGEIIKHLCAKGKWPLDENGEDLCLDSYGFAMPSDSEKGNEMSYWTADVKISQCHDVYENGRHQCTYNVEGYMFSINYGWQGSKRIHSKEWTSTGYAYLRCLKNRSKK